MSTNATREMTDDVCLADWGVIDGQRLRALRVTSPSQMMALQELRCRVGYCRKHCEKLSNELGREVPVSACPDRREFDQCDKHSYHVVATRDDQVVGTFRGIRCEEGFRLQEAVFDGEPFVLPSCHPITKDRVEARTTLELSRWVGPAIPSSNPGEAILISRLLWEGMLELALRVGRKHLVFGILEDKFLDLVSDGWPFAECLKTPGTQIYHGTRVRVCLLTTAKYPCRRTRLLTPAG